MLGHSRWIVPVVLGICVISGASSQEAKKFSIKTTGNPIPKEVSEGIQKLLVDSSIELQDSAGKPICDVWFRKDMPTEATPEQVKSGVTYKEVKQTEILGAIQFHRDWSDYRKQKIKAGVYTLRLAYQPSDGKHTPDLADFQEFALVIRAKADTKPGLLEPKTLHEKSSDSISLGHPGVFMLWPNSSPGKEPELAARAKNHWVLNTKSNLLAGGKATGKSFGIGLNLIGHSPAE